MGKHSKPKRVRRHLLHRWHIISVNWPAPHAKPHTIAYAICAKPGCTKRREFAFVGANLTIEAARLAI